MKFLLRISLALLVTLAWAGCDSDNDDPNSNVEARGPDAVYVMVEEPPQLIGGLEGLQHEVRYPEPSKQGNAEGTVFVQFIVDEEGRVTGAEVIRGVDPALDAEALRVVRQATFEPGTQKGEPVKVRFTIPIKFQLGVDGPQRD